MSIEEAHAELVNAVHDYANAATRVDRDGAVWDADVEPFEKVEIAVHGLLKMAVHDALEKARNSVPAEWKGVLDYIERIDSERIAALGWVKVP